jgi:hypothetical protein
MSEFTANGKQRIVKLLELSENSEFIASTVPSDFFLFDELVSQGDPFEDLKSLSNKIHAGTTKRPDRQSIRI